MKEFGTRFREDSETTNNSSVQYRYLTNSYSSVRGQAYTSVVSAIFE